MRHTYYIVQHWLECLHQNLKDNLNFQRVNCAASDVCLSKLTNFVHFSFVFCACVPNTSLSKKLYQLFTSKLSSGGVFLIFKAANQLFWIMT